MSHRNTGLSLIELAIVLTIVGMIVGGITVGRDLIARAKVNNAISESEKYTKAIGQFQEKYMALPGDFAGATALWNTTGATGTANGDGNGRITTQTTSTTFYEQFRAWQHLSNAGFIAGRFSGSASTANTQLRVVGTNIPTSSIKNAGWGLVTILSGEMTSDLLQSNSYIVPGTVLWLGGDTPAASSTTNQMTPQLTASDARYIDEKLDDGSPTEGKVRAQINASGTACYASNAYTVSNSNLICSVVFITGF